jgi:hypothetical protein
MDKLLFGRRVLVVEDEMLTLMMMKTCWLTSDASP